MGVDIIKTTIGNILWVIPLFIILTLLLSFCTAITPYSGSGIHFSIAVFAVGILKTSWFTLALSLLTFNKRPLKWGILAIVTLFAIGYTFLVYKFHVILNPAALALLLQTNLQETREFFKVFLPWGTVLLMLASATLVLLAYFGLEYVWRRVVSFKALSTDKNWRYIAVPFFLFIGFSIYSNTIKSNIGEKSGSLQALRSLIGTSETPISELYTSIKAIKDKADYIEKIYAANERVEISSCDYTSSTIVLVIGESFIKSHSNLYGYRLMTNPNLTSMRESGNLFVFNDVLSQNKHTNDCLQAMLSTGRIGLGWENRPLFPAVFKKAGYDVSFYSNQYTRNSGVTAFDYSITFFINPNKIHKQCFDFRNVDTYRYDEELIENLTPIPSEKPSLTIIQFNGQHLDADLRYPHTPEHLVFTADSINRRKGLGFDEKQAIAAYDNATRYNDYVLSRLIEKYADHNAIIIMTSDHGERVYDDSEGVYGREFYEQRLETYRLLHEVPFFIWCSDQYLESHPDIVERIKAAEDRPFLNDDVCHLLFDLAGINSTAFDSTHSPISDGFMVRGREINIGERKFNYDQHREEIDNIQLMSAYN